VIGAAFEGWAIVELLGHRRLAGHVTEVAMFGSAFLRLDVPSDPPVTQFYGGSTIYSITPTTEEIARRFAARNRPEPIQVWELPRLEAQSSDEIEDSIEGFADSGGVIDDDLDDDEVPL
jgi:hypothetical protein